MSDANPPAADGNESEELTFFLHVPKCGGSSIRTLIAQNYPADRIIGFSGNAKEVEWFKPLPAEKKRQYRIAHGHFPYGLHQNLSAGYSYFTFLREPVERHFSDFYFAIKYQEHNLHKAITSGKLTLADWATRGARVPYHRDTMVQYLAGDVGKNFPDEQTLAVATQHLLGFRAFGVMERFNESVLLLARAFGWRNIVYEIRNQSEGREPLSAELRDLAAPNFALDRRLHRKALEVLQDRVESGGNLFADALSDYENVLAQHASRVAGRRFEVFVVGKSDVASSLAEANATLQNTTVARYLGW